MIFEKFILGVFQNIHDSFDEIDSSGLVPYTVQSENGRETFKGFHKPLGLHFLSCINIFFSFQRRGLFLFSIKLATVNLCKIPRPVKTNKQRKWLLHLNLKYWITTKRKHPSLKSYESQWSLFICTEYFSNKWNCSKFFKNN